MSTLQPLGVDGENSSQFHRGLSCSDPPSTLQMQTPFPQCGDAASSWPITPSPQPQGTSLPTHPQAKSSEQNTLRNPIVGLALSPALEPMVGLNTAHLPLAVLCSPDVPSPSALYSLWTRGILRSSGPAPCLPRTSAASVMTASPTWMSSCDLPALAALNFAACCRHVSWGATCLPTLTKG